MKEQMKKNQMVVLLLVSFGIFLRFLCMAWGHNFDWESYCIVGEIAGRFGNVYAETRRYNYGPIFLCMQGTMYRLAGLNKAYFEILYRVMMVSTLTAADVGIMLIIARRYSVGKALIFFLNPISIIITGYHNQFDNIAVFLALCTLYFYNEEKKFNSRDVGFVAFFSLCLIMKHILFLVPVFLLLRPNLSIKKKLVYACVPPALFIVSFLPFAINKEGLRGILDHVFLYRSYNNFPLLRVLLNVLSVPASCWFAIYIILMVMIAFVTRKYDYEKQLLIYLIAMVAFSSAITNQYMVIPLVALCAFDLGKYRYGYISYGFLFLAYQGIKLHIQAVPSNGVAKMMEILDMYGYDLAAWILFVTLVYIFQKNYSGWNRRE